MKRLPIACLFLAGFCWLPAGARAENCSGLPTSFTGNQFPKGNFFTNFDNSCYLIPFSTGNGGTSEQGDLNSIYNKLFFNACPAGATNCINPNLPPYELIILGQFPNSRYFSISLYDNHSAITQNLTDVNVMPLTSGDINPYEPGVAFVSGQRYGAAIHLGGTPGAQQTGCMMTGYNAESNWMDGTQRHPFMNWNIDKSFAATNTPHVVDTPEHTNPNTAGVIIIRSYLDLTPAINGAVPHVIVRDVASGCAYPAAYVTGTMNVVTTNSNVGNPWQEQQQVQEHNLYANWESTNCWGLIPPEGNIPKGTSEIQWLRQDEYTAGANPDAAYLFADVPSGLPQTLDSAGEVMRFRFRVPATPPTPCVNGCSRSGNEQMRYISISFQIPGGGTLASIPDNCPANPVIPCTPMVQDANGNVTLIVGTGVQQPSQATAANGYTWLDLSKLANYLQLNEIAIRDILPSGWFNCPAQLVPFKVGQATTQGEGLMGLYSPLIDFPPASLLPTKASPVAGEGPDPSACGGYPSGTPAVQPACSVQPLSAIQISAVTTQCATPGCDQVIVQSSPPIAIAGQGFGSFPLGIPYNGNSNFLQITDTTQGWSAGYTGNACNVSIGEWSDSLISLVANVNQNGACPIAAGDQLDVTVWNPQTLSSATPASPVIVGAQSNGSRK
jgi:hypothetical protein